MKAVGLITEYNPLHNGHIYHLKEALKISGCDVSVVVMSGNFVQRGEPAIISKYQRCAAAIESGANLVLELPVYYALSSAEGFAHGAVKTLNELKVSSFVFGSEAGDINSLKQIASIISEEPIIYRTALKNELTTGKSFPAARQTAIQTYIQHFDLKLQIDILNSPNNILAIEYIKAALKCKCDITPLTIKRIGSDYNEKSFSKTMPSAQSIRRLISASTQNSTNSFSDNLTSVVPESMLNILDCEFRKSYPIELNDFTLIFNYKMFEIFESCDNKKENVIKTLCSYVDVNSELAARIYSFFDGSLCLYDFIQNIKCRQYTFSRISRCIFHIILNIKNSQKNKFEAETVPYIRILGFDYKGRQYLNQIKKSVSVPIITKTADYKDLIREDTFAASIYNQIVYNKFGTILKDDYRQSIYIKM